MFLPSLQKSHSSSSKNSSLPAHSSVSTKSAWLQVLPGQRPTILFLGRDRFTLSMMKENFGTAANIQCCQNIHEALSFLNSSKPDLILCDLQEQLHLFLETFQSYHLLDIPFLLMTNPEDRKANASLLEGRVTDLVLKPCPAEELNARIKSHLQNYLAKKLLQTELRRQNQPLEQLAQEITDRTKELHRLNKLKDEFMAVLSHELRNPINVISGFAEILKSGVDQPDLAREAADAIYRNSQIQIKLIADLFDISRGIAGKLVLDSKPMQVGAVLQEILPIAKEASRKKGVTLSCCCDAHGDLIQGDPIRISQVMWNLLTNALKFTPQGGRIDIRLSRFESWIEFSVQDTGHGIDPGFLPCMFERFNQQDSSITKKFGGLGLGLAIVRHIVELHSGTVTAHSKGLGHGATFTVRFPTLTN